MDVLNRILELRGEKGWSEYRLSVESGIPQSTISSWFRKKAQPSTDCKLRPCAKPHSADRHELFRF